MTKLKFFLLVLFSLVFLNAIKTNYGGRLTILLNEPVDFSYSTTNYSDSIFYSLIHENFFFMKEDGSIYSNIFSDFFIDKVENRAVLEVKKNLSFSNGSPVNANNVYSSLKVFLNRENTNAKKISRSIKSIKSSGSIVYIHLNYLPDNFFSLLSSPELVLLSMNENTFSGMMTPSEWERGGFLKLIPNRYYSGGHTYLDGVTVVFDEKKSPDVFLSEPGRSFPDTMELKAGVYQNIFLTFPSGKTGKNTRIALFSLIKTFFNKYNFNELSSLTSDSESPVSVGVTVFSQRKIKSILRNSEIKLYVNSSLKKFETDLLNYIKSNHLKISIIFIKSAQLREFLESGNSVDFYLTEKLFDKKTPVDEKIKRVIYELTFSGFNEKYLKIVNELEEMKYLNNTELMMDRLSAIIGMLINEEYILPLKQKNFSLYCKNKFTGLILDYHGRPLFAKIRLK